MRFYGIRQELSGTTHRRNLEDLRVIRPQYLNEWLDKSYPTTNRLAAISRAASTELSFQTCSVAALGSFLPRWQSKLPRWNVRYLRSAGTMPPGS